MPDHSRYVVEVADPALRRFHRAQGVLLVVLCLAFVGFVVQTARVISYGYETEWSEGGEYLAAQRIAQGRWCYDWPTTAAYPSVGYAYPPVYPALGALVRIAVGEARSGLWIQKALSVAAALGCAVVLFCAVYGQSRRLIPALIAALFLFAVEPGHRFLNVGRPDAAGLFLSLAALWVVGNERPVVRWWFVPLSVLAALTKQVYIAAAVAGLAYLYGRDRREAMLHAIVLSALFAGAVLYLDRVTNGAFLNNVVNYQWRVNSDTIHPSWSASRNFRALGGRLLTWTLVLQALAVPYVVGHWNERYRPGGQWLIGYVALTIVSLTSLVQWGAFTNRLLPGAALCNIPFGLALAEASSMWSRLSVRSRRWIVAVPALAVVHPAIHSVANERVDTSAATRAQADWAAKVCRSAPGPVLCEVPRVAICQARPDAVMHLGLMKPAIGPAAMRQLDMLRRDVAARKYSVVVLYTGLGLPDTFIPPDIYRTIVQQYGPPERLGGCELLVFRRGSPLLASSSDGGGAPGQAVSLPGQRRTKR